MCLAHARRKFDEALPAVPKEQQAPLKLHYEDNVSGKISDDRFSKMSKRYEQEQGENAKKIKALREELRKKDTQQMDMDVFLETVRRYTRATKLTWRMVGGVDGAYRRVPR